MSIMAWRNRRINNGENNVEISAKKYQWRNEGVNEKLAQLKASMKCQYQRKRNGVIS